LFVCVGSHPIGGCCWAARKKPQRLRANYHKTCGVRQFHAVYAVFSVGATASTTTATARRLLRRARTAA
jgi:hypothetical protein